MKRLASKPTSVLSLLIITHVSACRCMVNIDFTGRSHDVSCALLNHVAQARTTWVKDYKLDGSNVAIIMGILQLIEV